MTEADDFKKVVDDLVIYTKRLVKIIRFHNKNNDVCNSAMDYLKRMGLTKINLSRKE